MLLARWTQRFDINRQGDLEGKRLEHEYFCGHGLGKSRRNHPHRYMELFYWDTHGMIAHTSHKHWLKSINP
ncbi:hypothetical protein NDU88_006080 [Pleurodeles waltl]|uniref:Uncharacterized protein n=1 Tax=Pleurodeles waltl TaxID=8319 RepID=A0AAV7L2N9_PLEWA|nr:hypothetical protein NDU88_006080 [Pleurodeles waltl]